jgi:hypothetical protein
MALRALRYAALLALALAIFLAWMNPATLLPGNVGWVLRGSDWGQSSIGLNAYLRASNWPGSATPLILAPNGTHLLLMDANPLAGLLLAPVARWLPGLQVIGPWLLLCLILHVGFAYALVRRHAPDFLTAWLGTALLTLLPTLFNRYGHATLCAHWLILWALWIFVDHRRARSLRHWAAVIAVAALIHSYLLLMVGAIWASALLHQLVTAPDNRARREGAIMAAGVGLLVLVLALLDGVVGSGLVSTGTYGNFTLSLDALWNPANPSYTALLPSTPSPAGNAAAFEGFQYLGAGLLALVLAMLALSFRRRPQAQWFLALRGRLASLLPALAILTLLAIGPTIRWGGITQMLFHPPSAMLALFDLVRASGRLFWPVAYALVFFAVVSSYRLSPRAATIVLSIALTLQVVDMVPMFAAIRATTAEASDRVVFKRTPDPRWDALIGRAGAIEMEPPEPFRDLALMEEIGWRAVSHCRPMRYIYASRVPAATQSRIDADRRQFIAGRLDPTRLYIVYTPQDAPAALRDRLMPIDGVAVIAPTATGTTLPGCRAAH